MDFFTQLEISQGPHPQQNDPHKIMEISLFDSFFDEFNTTPQMQYESKKLYCFNEFDDLENLNSDFNLSPLDEHFEVDIPEPSMNEEMALPPPLPSSDKKKKKKRSSNALEFYEIKKYFDVPISEAAKKMNVGLTHLKRRCRELKITRWPHRKLKCLELLINNLNEMGLANEVIMLENEKKMLEKLPSIELNQETKKLRQAFAKANYMRRRRFMTPSP